VIIAASVEKHKASCADLLCYCRAEGERP